MIDGWPWRLKYYPANAIGQFFISQSRLPNIPRKPRSSLLDNSLSISFTLGDLKYTSPKISTITQQNLFIERFAVDSSILTYSSVKFVHAPYAIIRKTAVTFFKVDPCLLVQFFFVKKNYHDLLLHQRYEEIDIDAIENVYEISLLYTSDLRRSTHSIVEHVLLSFHD